LLPTAELQEEEKNIEKIRFSKAQNSLPFLEITKLGPYVFGSFLFMLWRGEA
jgi:hypothetical protein